MKRGAQDPFSQSRRTDGANVVKRLEKGEEGIGIRRPGPPQKSGFPLQRATRRLESGSECR